MIDKEKKDIRVRAIILTQNDCLLVIKRIRKGRKPYWVFPGGGIEPSDKNNFEKALIRELVEELNSNIKKIEYPTYITKKYLENNEVKIEIFYLVKVESWSEMNRSGPEFKESTGGIYTLEEIPFQTKSISPLNLQPEEVKNFVIERVDKKLNFPKINLIDFNIISKS